MPLRHSPEIALQVLEALIEGCQVIGPDFTYRYLNPAAALQGQHAREELLGRTMAECYPGIESTPMFEVLKRCMVDAKPETMLNEFELPDGSKGTFELRFIPIPLGVCVLSLDVTERKAIENALARTETQLRHAQKMEAVGRLAGGISHDFNNLLSVILSYCDLMVGDLKHDDPLRADVLEIQKAGQRAAELTRQLLAFSRQQVLTPTVLDLNQVLVGMEKMTARLIGAHIELTTLLSPALGKVRADAGSIEQMMMNLVVNACDAMPQGGKLTIQTNNVDLDEQYAREHHDVLPGRYVMIAVTDSGVGMDRETQARAFEPFFTTKEAGKGTGLGLATVYGIVKQSGGHIWLYSEPGRGTTFKIYFPRATGAMSSVSKPPTSKPPGGGSETILLVEDDDQVRGVVRGILRRHGYFVLEARTAGDALLVSEQHGAKIDLLLSDVVLPRMSGPELAQRLKASRPEMRVLFTSGYTGEAVVQHGLLDSGVPFLQKPITPDSLAHKVRDALDG